VGTAIAAVLADRSPRVPKFVDEFIGVRRSICAPHRPKSAYMTTAATKSSMGAANAIFRRTARSCAAPFACHAAHRSSKPGESPPAVDVVIEGGAAIVGTSVTMCPHASGFSEGLARMAESSEKSIWPVGHARSFEHLTNAFRHRLCRLAPYAEKQNRGDQARADENQPAGS
jgi:hypothetical protein